METWQKILCWAAGIALVVVFWKEALMLLTVLLLVMEIAFSVMM